MSKILRGYKYRIYPTEDQAKKIDKYTNLFRYVYNWGIAKEKEVYESHKQGLSEYGFYNFIELCTIFTQERNKSENEWLKEIPMTTARLALRNVINAYKRFFRGENRYPRFKSKKKQRKRESSFNTRNDRFKIHNDGIKIEGIQNSYISLGFDTLLNLNKVINPCISRDYLGNYYVSFSLEEESKDLETSKTEGIGIDLGIRRTFTLSTGEIYNQPKEKLEKLERRRRKIDRHVTRDINRRLYESMRTKTKYEDIPKSKRAIKRELKRKRLYDKIHNIKDTFYHTITKQIVMRNPEYICMETFSVSKIEENYKYMSKYLCNTSFYYITQKMKDKCNMYNIPFIQAPINFASTQICSNCGSIKNMDGKHTYKCPVCGMVEDRDINAAINLRNYGSLIIAN